MMNSDDYSKLEVDKRHVHLMSPHYELEASGLQVASFARSEMVVSKDTGHRICGHRKTTFWLSLALVAFVAMGVTGISIAGCLAARWKSESKEK